MNVSKNYCKTMCLTSGGIFFNYLVYKYGCINTIYIYYINIRFLKDLGLVAGMTTELGVAISTKCAFNYLLHPTPHPFYPLNICDTICTNIQYISVVTHVYIYQQLQGM